VSASPTARSSRRLPVALVAGGAVLLLAALTIVAFTQGAEGELTAARAIFLGIVEGVTEYLPISSTGHLILSERLLGLADTDAAREAADTYAIAIQLGAILAVLILYWERIATMVRGITAADVEGRRLLTALVVAFVPAAVIGVLLEGVIKDRLFGLGPIAAAWIVGGVFILWLAQHLRIIRPGCRLEEITVRTALIIGVAQVLALWPGTSRSLVTLAAGVLAGLSLAAAVEFSFLLGLATLSAATLYELAKNGSGVVEQFGILNPLLGMIAAAVSAAIAVRWMVTYLQRHSLAIFGWYRLAVGAALAIGILLTR